jgi:hypothetical protein
MSQARKPHGLWIGAVALLGAAAFIFIHNFLPIDPFRSVRHSRHDAVGLLNQFGIDFIASKPELVLDWVLVEGFDTRTFTRTTDSNIFITYRVAPTFVEAEWESWQNRQMPGTNAPAPTNWDFFTRPPEWWPKDANIKGTVARINQSVTVVVYLNKLPDGSGQFYVVAKLL